MTTVDHYQRPPMPGIDLPTQATRVAADRAARLAAEHGAHEAVAFYDMLTVSERRLVFALLARQAGPTPAEQAPDSPWWTADEVRQAHALWNAGHRSEWIVVGQRLYTRDHKRVERAARRATSPDPAAGGKPRVNV